jgi:hypothetical protein
MASEGGWTGFAILSLILLAALTGGASGSQNPSIRDVFGNARNTLRTSGNSPSVSSNIPTGPLVTCPGFIVGQRTDRGMTLRVYYSPENGGTNCVSATRNSAVDSRSYLRTEIRISRYSGRNWPSYATRTGAFGQETVSGAYVTGADNLCVSANVTYFPSGGQPSSISMRRFACG